MPTEAVTGRKAQKRATRKKIRAAALACFREHGFKETSIGVITKAAEVAHGTFYVHFQSKEALLEECLNEFNEGLVGRLLPIWQAGSVDEREQLIRDIAGAMLDYWSERSDFVLVYAQRINTGVGLNELRDGINPPVASMLELWLDDVVGDRSRDAVSTRLVGQALLAMWVRVVLQYLFSEAVDRAAAVETLVAMTDGAINSLLRGND